MERHGDAPGQIGAVQTVLRGFPEAEAGAGRTLDAEQLYLNESAQGGCAGGRPTVVKGRGQGFEDLITSVVIAEVGVVRRSSGEAENEAAVGREILGGGSVFEGRAWGVGRRTGGHVIMGVNFSAEASQRERHFEQGHCFHGDEI
jgi:hypothetical protein